MRSSFQVETRRSGTPASLSFAEGRHSVYGGSMKSDGTRGSFLVLRIREVCRRSGLSRATIYRLMSSGDFPKGHRLSRGAVGWSEEEVDRWIADKLGITGPR
jgi:prophage regulatory protein